MMNLHNTVRGAVTSIAPDVTCTLYISTGTTATLTRGNTEQIYRAGITVKAQFQSMSPNTMQLADKVGTTTTTRRVYLYATKAPADRPWAQWRPLNRSGDYIKDDNNNYWLIDAVLEDFSRVGWVSVQATLQTTPVTLHIEDEDES